MEIKIQKHRMLAIRSSHTSDTEMEVKCEIQSFFVLLSIYNFYSFFSGPFNPVTLL